MAPYAFMSPLVPGKLQTWMQYVREMKTTYRSDMEASRRRIGLSREEVWLQQSPTGACAVIVWEAPDISVVFKELMTSEQPFDRWFRDHVLIEVHGMNPGAPPPPLNEKVMG